MTDYEDLQKRCQRGATSLNDANNLLADCYGMLGTLGAVAKAYVIAGEREHELRTELAELRKDAERYRWLKEKGLHHSIDAATAAIAPGVGPFICVQLPSSGAPNRVRLGVSADAYVDLAMSKEG